VHNSLFFGRVTNTHDIPALDRSQWCSFFRNLRQLPSVEFPAHSTSSVLLGQTPLPPPPSSYKSKKGAAVVVLGDVGLRLLVALFANAFRPRPRRGLRIKSESDWPILVMHIFVPRSTAHNGHATRRQWSSRICDIYVKQKGRRLSSYLCALRAPITSYLMCACAFLCARPDMIPRGRPGKERDAQLFKPPISQQPNYTRCAITLSAEPENYICPQLRTRERSLTKIYGCGVRERGDESTYRRLRQR
jgi:hypothetical protein